MILLNEDYNMSPGKVSDNISPVESALENDNREGEFLKQLISRGNLLEAKEVSQMLVTEQKGLKRISILIILRQLYKNLMLPEAEKILITENLINRKVAVSQDRTRRNMVRRIF